MTAEAGGGGWGLLQPPAGEEAAVPAATAARGR